MKKRYGEVMPTLSFDFVWKKGDKTLVFPVKIAKSVESNWKSEDNLICNECDTQLNQKYVCSKCENQHTIGQVKKRKNRDIGVIFTKEEYKQFMKQNVKSKLTVIGEIPLSAIIPNNLELIEGNFLEVFNNDEDYQVFIFKLKEYLTLKEIALLVVMGYYEKNRAIILIPTKSKLLAVFLRDKRLVRTTNQNGVLIEQTEYDKILKGFTLDKNIDNYYKFLELKKKGESIPIVVEEKKEEVKTETSWLDKEIEELKNNKKEKKKKKVAVKVGE